MFFLASWTAGVGCEDGGTEKETVDTAVVAVRETLCLLRSLPGKRKLRPSPLVWKLTLIVWQASFQDKGVILRSTRSSRKSTDTAETL